MFTLRCTGKLLKRLRASPGVDLEPPTTQLGDWYATLVYERTEQLVLCVSERSLLPVVLPAKEARTLVPRFRDALAELLARLGVPPAEIERERAEMADVRIGKTASRQVLGSMNDFLRMLSYRPPRRSLLDESRQLTPRSVDSSVGECVPEPASDLAGGHAPPKPPERMPEADLVVDREGSEAALQIGPEQLDGVELGAVSREVDRVGACGLDGGPDRQHLVDVQVVHHHDVARAEPRDQARSNEADEGRAGDGARMSHQLWLRPEPDRADERDRFPGAERPGPDHPRTAKAPAELAAHARLAERFVDEDEALFPDRAHQGAKDAPPLEVVRGVALYRDEGLFFRE